MTGTVDERVWSVAAAQHGGFTREQACAAGASDSVIKRRIASGHWVRGGRHVLRIAGSPRTWRQRVMLAVLDAGEGAAATDGTAAGLWGLPGSGRGAPEVLVPRGRHHRPGAGCIRETRILEPHHVCVRDGIPVVSPARLVVELAGREHLGRVERVLDAALASDLLVPTELALVVAELAHRGRRGAAGLRSLVEARLPGYAPPASELEARFRDLVRAAGLPEPVRQLDVGGRAWVGRVDVCYPSARLVVELDSRRWHDGHLAREDDRRRDNELVVAGWRVIRITWRHLVDDPSGVVALLRRLLVVTEAA